MQRSRAWMLGALAAVAATPAAGASAAPWARGDVFAGIRGGQYKVYDNGGTLKDTIATGDSGEATGCAVTPNGVYGTLFAGGGIPLIDINDPHAVKTTYPSDPTHPESLAFARDGTFYVGHADGMRSVQHYDASGQSLRSFTPTTEGRGTDWIDLAADQKTIFYTSEGKLVKRYDVSAAAQLP